MLPKIDKAPRRNPTIKPTDKKGLIIVHTGSGKGKSTAAFGTAVRAMGWGKRVGIVQFMKGAWKTGEEKFFRKFPDQCVIYSIGKGFTWETQSFEDDVQTAQKAWARCRDLLDDPRYFLVIFDEINYAFKYNFLDIQEVICHLKNKPAMKHVILTGNGAPKELISIADLVTDMKCVKHPYRQGIKAQPGIEY